MGRDVRMVPPNWDHPKDGSGRYKPMHPDKTFEEAAEEWKREFAAWERGERPSYCDEESRALEFWEYEDVPPTDREMYRPWQEAEATWYQVWENVSEGTPVTPPFATKDELIQYLADNGDFWDQKRGDGAWGYARAKAFVDSGYAPSMAIIGGEVLASRDVALALKTHAK